LKTERKQFNQSAVTWNLMLPVIVLAISMQAVAQAPQGGTLNSQQGGSPSATNDKATSDNVNAEILEELERMRTRIQELESRLKRREADMKSSTKAELPVANQKLVGNQVLPSQGAEQQPAGASDEQTPRTKAEPFAFADWTWLNGNPRTKEAAFDSKFFTPEVRVDVAYHYDFNHPKDDTISGSSEVFRSNEVGLTHLGIGGDFHYDHVRARVLSQIGLYSTATPRNDASYSRGQWQLDNAYRYVNEAYGGYHFDALHGINVDAGIFLSYVGLFSFYNFDNWAYQS
jgi:hypothetical protein